MWSKQSVLTTCIPPMTCKQRAVKQFPIIEQPVAPKYSLPHAPLVLEVLPIVPVRWSMRQYYIPQPQKGNSPFAIARLMIGLNNARQTRFSLYKALHLPMRHSFCTFLTSFPLFGLNNEYDNTVSRSYEAMLIRIKLNKRDGTIVGRLAKAMCFCIL